MSDRIPLSLIDELDGQIPGVPGNPRSISDEALSRLAQSLREDPEMLELRELLVYPYKGRYITIGGNMRLRALKSIGATDAPCKIIPKETPAHKLRAYVIKDNNSSGKYDPALLMGWDDSELRTWIDDFDSLGIPGIAEIVPSDVVLVEPLQINRSTASSEHREQVEDEAVDEAVDDSGVHDINHRKKNGIPEKVVDIANLKPAMHKCLDSFYFTLWQGYEPDNVDEGVPLSAFKAPEHMEMFIGEAVMLLKRIGFTDMSDWAFLTTPKRRHKVWHFATEIAREVSVRMGGVFYEDAIRAVNSRRLDPIFELNMDIPQKNILIVDDIVTTSSTMIASRELFKGKNTIFIAGVQNK